MHIFIISDNIDTIVGMRLAGITGVIAHTESEVKAALDLALNDSSIALVLITQRLFKLCDKQIYSLKLKLKRPLITEIPDRHGDGTETVAHIREYIKDSIGIII
jgi:V/A-type H+-transporting ATPase subunit F